jgi:hypothetical protein
MTVKLEDLQQIEGTNGKSTTYDTKRRNEYPSVEEQLDILYHEGYDGWKLVIQAVKAKYPKPE